MSAHLTVGKSIRFELKHPYGLVGSKPAASPLRRVKRSAEHGGFEDIERWKIHKGEHREIQSRLCSESSQPRAITKLVYPWLRGEGVDIEQLFEDVHLVKVLKAAEIRRAEQTEEQTSLPVDVSDRGLGDDNLRKEVGSSCLCGGDEDIVGKWPLPSELSIGERGLALGKLIEIVFECRRVRGLRWRGLGELLHGERRSVRASRMARHATRSDRDGAAHAEEQQQRGETHLWRRKMPDPFVSCDQHVVM